jgi:hypothetical protein
LLFKEVSALAEIWESSLEDSFKLILNPSAFGRVDCEAIKVWVSPISDKRFIY